MAQQYICVTGVEPVSALFGEQVGNAALYNVLSGNAASYSVGDMVVTSAAGTITHNGVSFNTISDTVTLVADSADPRWSTIGRDSTGDLILVSGDPAINPTVPEPGDYTYVALVKIQANQTIAFNCTAKVDKRVPATVISKYNTATQGVGNPTTTYEDIDAATGTMSFWADASAVYLADYYVPLAFGGTGGAKFQITGPAAPTAVTITGDRVSTGATENTLGIVTPIAAVAALSSDIASFASGAMGTGGLVYPNNATACYIHIRLTLRNGATAGLVTLQGAQNNANSTTTVGLGATMTVRRP